MNTQTSKMTLYFYPVLKSREQGLGKDIHTKWAKLNARLDASIETFVHRTGARVVGLLLSSSGIAYAEDGYAFPDEEGVAGEMLAGLRGYPCIYCYPKMEDKLRLAHWPNVISLLMDNQEELDQYREPFYYFDERAKSTYFMARVDPRVTLIIVYEELRKKSDSVVYDFATMVADRLRLRTAFRNLQPQQVQS